MTAVYVSLQDFKAYLGISDDSEDAVLQRLLDNAEAWIDRHFDATFSPQVSDARAYGPDALAPLPCDERKLALWLDRPLLLLESIMLPDGSVLTGADVKLYPLNTEAKWYAVFDGIEQIAIGDGEAIARGVWGYTKFAPPDVMQLEMRLAAYWYRQRDSQMAFSATPELGSITTPSDIPDDVLRMIADLQASYRLG